MRSPVLLTLLPFALCALACSQRSGPAVNLFGGYSFTTDFGPGYGTSANENAWTAAFEVDSSRWVGFKADFAQYHATYNYGGGIAPNYSTTYTYLFGPTVRLTRSLNARVAPFAEFLLGRGTLNSHPNLIFTPGTSFMWATGGGADVRITRHVALRGEVDALHSQFTSYDNQMQPSVRNLRPRVVTGIVYRF